MRRLGQAQAAQTTNTVAGGSGGIRLPVTNGGHAIYVRNISPTNTLIYPPVGGSFRNFGASFSFTGEAAVWCTALSANFYDLF